jgi:RNA polymerase sigma-70 factor (ECF subfamily)
MDQLTIKSLIIQIQQGNISSFRKLVEYHQPFAYATAFRILCNKYEAEEVVQDAFIRVWKHIVDFKTEMRFTTWLYKIIVNLAFDRIKAQKVKMKYIHFDIESSVILNKPSTCDIESELIDREYAQIIQVLTEMLTPKQKIVFVLSELEGLSSGEISEITGLSTNKIKSNLYCARQEIKEKLSSIEKGRAYYAV